MLDKHGNGKWAKVPKIAGTKRNASHSNPKTWHSFEAYTAYAQAHDYYDGVFYAFWDDDPFVGEDYDHSYNGTINDWAAGHIPTHNTYNEISPSGTGIKSVAIGALFSAQDTVRRTVREKAPFAITGHILADYATIRPAQDAIDTLLARRRRALSEVHLWPAARPDRHPRGPAACQLREAVRNAAG